MASLPATVTLTSTFNTVPLPYPIPIYIQAPSLTPSTLLAFPAFRDWLTRLLTNLALQNNPRHTFHSRPLRLQRIDVESVTWFGTGKVGFMKVQAKVQNYDDGDDEEAKGKNEKETVNKLRVPGAVFLRGGSVAVLILIKPTSSPNKPVPVSDLPTYALLTIQPRIAASSLAFPEIPAGMLDEATSDFAGTAAKEVYEETSLKVNVSEMVNMSELAVEGVRLDPSSKTSAGGDAADDSYETIASSMYPSPGACDESIPLFLCQKRMPQAALDDLRGRATGLRDEGEAITVKVVKFEDLWREGGRDGKCLAALGLYYSLREAGRLPEWPEDVGEGDDVEGKR